METFKINEDNWLETTMNALEELRQYFELDIEQNEDEETIAKAHELEALIGYLNKTN